MARKPAPQRKRGGGDDDAGDGRKIGKDHNVKKFDGEILSKYLETCMASEDRQAKRLADAQKKNTADRKLIKDATKELTESGYEAKPLAAIRRKAKLLYKAETIDSTLDDEQKEVFQSMDEALGPFRDTPLGKAAMQRGE